MLLFFLEIMNLTKITIAAMNKDSKSKIEPTLNYHYLPYQDLVEGVLQNLKKFKWNEIMILHFIFRSMKWSIII